jgi:hypothetical protein
VTHPAVAQQPAVPLLRLEREVRVDAAENDLSPIGWLAVASDGSIAISQPQDHHVRFFSPRGIPTATFGRKGHGPGEFGAMTLHGRVGDTLWVGDFETRRFTLIGPDGRLVRSNMFPNGIRFPEDTPRPWPSFISAPPWGLYHDGDVLLLPYPAGEVTPGWMKRPEGTLMPFVRVTRDGLFERVIAWTHLPHPECLVNTRTGSRTKPLCFRPFWAVSARGGVIVTVTVERSDAQNDYVRALAVKGDGDTLFTTLMTVPRQRIPRNVADSVREGFMRAVSKSSPGETVSLDLPDAFPPYEKALVSADEKTIWLESGVATGNRAWRILEMTGRPIGSVQVPHSTQLRVVSLERVWATERDSDGLESVVVFRVQR